MINLLLNLPVVPLPGASSLGQLILLREAALANQPWLVGLAGGLGMGFGEIPPYFLGAAGRDISTRSRLPKKFMIDRMVRRLSAWIATLMERSDVLVVFTLALIPNPFLEVSALFAGAAEIPLRRFVPALVFGKLGRGLLLVAIGAPFGL